MLHTRGRIAELKKRKRSGPSYITCKMVCYFHFLTQNMSRSKRELTNVLMLSARIQPVMQLVARIIFQSLSALGLLSSFLNCCFCLKIILILIMILLSFLLSLLLLRFVLLLFLLCSLTNFVRFQFVVHNIYSLLRFPFIFQRERKKETKNTENYCIFSVRML